MSQEYVVYILRNTANRLYVGQTKRLREREKEHRGSHGATFVSRYGGGFIVYTETYRSLTESRHREQQLKGWSRAKKEALIRGDIETVRRLAKGRAPRQARGICLGR